jgi:hypothetical protein
VCKHVRIVLVGTETYNKRLQAIGRENAPSG